MHHNRYVCRKQASNLHSAYLHCRLIVFLFVVSFNSVFFLFSVLAAITTIMSRRNESFSSHFKPEAIKLCLCFFPLLPKLPSNLWSLFSVRFSKIHLFDIFLAFHVNPLAFYFILKIKISDYNISLFFFVLFFNVVFEFVIVLLNYFINRK